MAIVPSFLPFSDSINGKVNSFFGADSIDVIRSVDWDTNYLWTVDFFDAGPPVPFASFFPASDVSLPMAILETDTINFGQTDIQIPLKSKSKELSITFYDDEKRTLLRYFKDWIELDILNGGYCVSGIKDNHKLTDVHRKLKRTVAVTGDAEQRVKPMRGIELKLLDKSRKSVLTYRYKVFPTGQLDFSGTQASEAQTYTMTFVIVSELKESTDTKSSYADLAKGLLGRFI